MVKKIRLIEEETEIKTLDNQEFQAKLLELLGAIDWKLWEMLKIEQQRVDREQSVDTTDEFTPSTPVKSVIVDEDETNDQ